MLLSNGCVLRTVGTANVAHLPTGQLVLPCEQSKSHP
jgi:hypothetical protein